jgi:2-keto-3-deoxy-L-rhamnonate aldolase RhmA
VGKAAPAGAAPCRWHQHLADAAANTIVVAQVEDKHAHAQRADRGNPTTERRIGPSDLSLSLGLPGQLDHPTVVDAIDQIAADVTASSDCALCVLVDTVEQAATWRDRGARIVLFNATTILAHQLRQSSGQGFPPSASEPHDPSARESVRDRLSGSGWEQPRQS